MQFSGKPGAGKLGIFRLAEISSKATGGLFIHQTVGNWKLNLGLLRILVSFVSIEGQNMLAVK